MTQASATQQGREQASDETAIHPFHVNVPETELTRKAGTSRPWEQPVLFSEEVRAGFRSLR
jgi:hypothetical protein